MGEKILNSVSRVCFNPVPKLGLSLHKSRARINGLQIPVTINKTFKGRAKWSLLEILGMNAKASGLKYVTISKAGNGACQHVVSLFFYGIKRG